MKMFVFPLMIVVIGLFGQLLPSAAAAPMEEDLKSSNDAERFRDALVRESLQNLTPQQAYQIVSYFLAQNRGMSKRDDDLPPGFIGVRGRRSNIEPLAVADEFYRKLFQHSGPNMLISSTDPKGLMKKGDNTNVYKDGFLGVRG